MLDTIWWEAGFRNGARVSEARGATYERLDRDNLYSFLVRDAAGPIIELTADDGRTGHNLFYRRRTALLGDMKVIYVVGWIPQGPLFALDPADFEVWESPDFIIGDPVFYPPMPYAFERWSVPAPTNILNPAYEGID